MSESLRDQLLKSGLARTLKPEPKPNAAGAKKKPPQRQRRPHRPGEDMNLAKAYALRDNAERAERERERLEAERRAKEKRERKQKLATLLDGKALNAADAEIPRHFPHQNKIRRVYVTEAQLPRLNGGELGVVQHGGHFLIVERAIAEHVREIEERAVVLLCDPHSNAGEDDIPADIVW